MDPSHKGISIMPFLFAAHQGLTTNRLFSNKHLVHPPSNWKIVSHHLPYLFHLPASNYRSAAYIFYTNVDRQCRSNLKRSEEHTSELQSRFDLVCRLLLEKKITENKKSAGQ